MDGLGLGSTDRSQVRPFCWMRPNQPVALTVSVACDRNRPHRGQVEMVAVGRGKGTPLGSARQNAGGDVQECLGPDGPPRTPDDAAFLTRYESWSRWFIVGAAILLPDGPAQERQGPVHRGQGWGSWLIFLVDYIVQTRTRVKYLKSRSGMFDFVIVVLTSPGICCQASAGWPDRHPRLARLVRVLLVARGARRLIERLGRAALVAAVVVLLCSLVAYRVEQPVNPEFATHGDAVWWGYVTLTTVGYGDVVPITPRGGWPGGDHDGQDRPAGVLAGSMSSFFKLSPAGQEGRRGRQEGADQAGIGDPHDRDDTTDSWPRPPGREPWSTTPAKGSDQRVVQTDHRTAGTRQGPERPHPLPPPS